MVLKYMQLLTQSGSGEDGIRAVLANHITVRNCTVDSFTGHFTGYTDDFLAENNICKQLLRRTWNLCVKHSDRVIIRYNQCYNNKAAGIQLNPEFKQLGRRYFH